MKRVNFPRFIWVSSIFIVLIIILIAVVNYKIYFQYRTPNNIYFYECDGNLCVTEVKDDKHLLYSKYECGRDACPVFKSEINDSYVILETKSNKILFNYINDKVVSLDYDDYKFLNNNYLIVTNNGYKGIINIENKVIVPTEYEMLGIQKEDYLIGYTATVIIAKKDNKYGILSVKTGEIIEKFEYDESQLDNLLKILEEKDTSIATS